MKKALSFVLSVLILLSTVWVGLTGITVAAESSTPIVDLNDAAVWVPNPNKPAMAVSLVTEDEYTALKVSSADYKSMYVEVELNTSTNYSLLFDFKSALKFENIQIWPLKCNPHASDDGTVTAKVIYTADEANMVIFKGWYEGDDFRSGNEAYTFEPAEVNAENLVAKFVSRNLMVGAGSFENHGAEKSLRVSPAGTGVLPDGSKVVQLMVNHQHLEYYGNRSFGMLAMLYFSEDGKNVQLEYFSTVNGMFYMEKFQFEFTLDIK